MLLNAQVKKTDVQTLVLIIPLLMLSFIIWLVTDRFSIVQASLYPYLTVTLNS